MNKKPDLRKMERISKALGDQYRLEIVEAIYKQQDWMQCSCIIDKFDLAQSTVSHHMKQLLDADLLIAEKDGRNAKYLINKETFEDYLQYINRFGK